MKTHTKNLVIASLFVALGLLIPILFHAVGLGSIFLPMFLPMAIAAFLLDWKYAIAVGALTPIISALLTGMPPISPPIAQLMVFEGIALVGITAWGFRCWRGGTLLPLAAGMLASRAVLLFSVALLAPIIGLPPKMSAIVVVLKGAPGVILILIVTPLLVNRLRNEPIVAPRGR